MKTMAIYAIYLHLHFLLLPVPAVVCFLPASTASASHCRLLLKPAGGTQNADIPTSSVMPRQQYGVTQQQLLSTISVVCGRTRLIEERKSPGGVLLLKKLQCGAPVLLIKSINMSVLKDLNHYGTQLSIKTTHQTNLLEVVAGVDAGLDLSLPVEFQQLEHSTADELITDVAQMEAAYGFVGLHQFQGVQGELVVPGLGHGQQVLFLTGHTVGGTLKDRQQSI